MNIVECAGLAALHRLDPERAHGLAIRAVSLGLVPLPGAVSSPRLATSIAGLTLPNPVGLAAGFDKNAEAAGPLTRAGFGFVEVGAATPRPQPGNPKPRLFRLREDRAVINRFGFNNDGAGAVAARLSHVERKVPVGINLGANKDSSDRAADFAKVLATVGPHVDFATVNVSSPNTEKLRDLQGKAALSALLAGVLATRDTLDRPIPIFLKIAPDLTDAELADVAEVAMLAGIDAVIATNTTLSRDGLASRHKAEAGGLSGRPLLRKSTRVLARLSQLTEGRLPLIGVGGISSAEDARQKILAGASAVQLYSALVYQGLSLAARIARELDAMLKREGVDNISDLVGQGRDAWLKP
ncbi:quinone-dependent dihydroorotate dehydrogenase [Defluviimonas sp. WL0002]|uniref:Dihydroorotate dehydrogenase (quinone) n=1 Tax=Albidovulum marisflavi TaxID=2984159 RepID=A0ABT2ZAZ5_9RHOB|nr:quinone-dependent dihydroorotate dehydrogenase [Defluviimonas sp. WL0002]MCV2868284.1 quinone-dependent dihydroorotate dehydrogenase [Defluviimonas sp. WL0002]